jgi:Xaa-Pro dipeptidase
MSARRERALAAAEGAGTDVLVAVGVADVAWLTGFAAEIETGASPFALPPLAVVSPGEPPTLIVSEDDESAAAATGSPVRTYTGYTLGPIDPATGARDALRDVVGTRRAAARSDLLPAALAGAISWVDLGDRLQLTRAVKDADELDRIRSAIALCDVGQREARLRAEPGMTELELWTLVRGAIERAASCRTPILADLVSGPRTAEVGGPPGQRALVEGDLVLCDLVPRLAGYWGDSCATFAVGDPSAAATEMHARSLSRLEQLVDAVRPGALAADLDALGRTGLGYPHHTGHGLGTDWHEEPRIVPDSRTVLEPGMVVALEPGLYGDDEGVRVEQVVLVTDDGCEVLSGHELSL